MQLWKRAGYLAALAYMGFALGSYFHYPQPYSPLRNWLSDLGNTLVNTGGGFVYNFGCIATGCILVFFFVGLNAWRTGDRVSGRLLTIAQASGGLLLGGSDSLRGLQYRGESGATQQVFHVPRHRVDLVPELRQHGLPTPPTLPKAGGRLRFPCGGRDLFIWRPVQYPDRGVDSHRHVRELRIGLGHGGGDYPCPRQVEVAYQRRA